MKLGFRLIPILAVAVLLVTFVVARSQVQSEKRGMRADLDRRAEILAESLQETVEPVIQQGSTSQLRRIVDRFGNREHLIGVAIYDDKGVPLAMSPKLDSLANVPPAIFQQCVAQDESLGGFETLGQSAVEIYAVPLHRGAAVAGALLVFHDASYIEAQSAAIWRGALWNSVSLILLVVLITLLLVRWMVLQPIRRAAQWMRDLRQGKTAPPPAGLTQDFLGPLSFEAASLGQHLNAARAAAKEEARLREAGDSQWTAERLRIGIQRSLKGSPLFVVSNREPYQHVHGSKGIEVRVPASGLVTALEPVLCACDGTWIASGSADADRETVDAHDHLSVPPDHPLYTLRRVWLTPEEERGYYLGFANEGIWPLCHIAHTRPVFRETDWEFYRQVNEKFADALAQEIENTENPYILIQDFHFALLPRLIKQRRPDALVAIFWHIPWPNPEAFRICPWEKELLDGLLGADLVSFHIQAHCNNFLETVDQSLESRIEWDRFMVNRNDHITTVRPHPISVALPGQAPSQETLQRQRGDVLASLGPDVIFYGVGVDRIDYTKGIVERFKAIEYFLEKYPHFRGQFSFVQFGAPSRTDIKRYQDLMAEVVAEAERINARWKTDRWRPIVLFSTHHSHAEIEPYYRTADFCLVTSLHDGMNLVAKEFVSGREDEDGVLILSQFTGASRALRDALLINPYDTSQMAEMIRRALEMPIEERRTRMRRMRQVVRDHNVYRWAGELIADLSEVHLEIESGAPAASSTVEESRAKAKESKAKAAAHS